MLYNIPQRTGSDMPNDLLAELAQLEHVVGVKQSNDDNLAKIDGLQIYAGNDDIVRRRCSTSGSPAGSSCRAHLFGEELRRMVDEPDRRREIDAEPAGRLPRPRGRAARLLDEGGAEHDRPGRWARRRLPYVELDERETGVIRAMLERHGLLQAAAEA